MFTKKAEKDRNKSSDQSQALRDSTDKSKALKFEDDEFILAN